MKDLFEKLAAIEHERWADWQKYVHSLCVQGQIPKDSYEHWERQIATPYDELSEQEKESDRDQVRRYWPLIESQQARIEKLEAVAEAAKDLYPHSYPVGDRAEQADDRLREALADLQTDKEQK